MLKVFMHNLRIMLHIFLILYFYWFSCNLFTVSYNYYESLKGIDTDRYDQKLKDTSKCDELTILVIVLYINTK